jgi:hypothetical protein
VGRGHFQAGVNKKKKNKNVTANNPVKISVNVFMKKSVKATQ